MGGIRATKELQILLDKAFVAVQSKPRSGISSATISQLPSNDDGEINVVECALRLMSMEDAIRTLNDHNEKLSKQSCDETDGWLPIDVLRAMETVIGNCERGQQELHVAIQQSRELVFTQSTGDGDSSKDSDASKEQIKFRRRMDRLRLKNEETKYNKLTSNLGTCVDEDDVTTKSMTYAASIGLNMIIAPLAFGCFMYFFAGSLLDYFWKRETTSLVPNQPDVRKVIAGVVSGVLMLFIEMILFVIRTHEVERFISQKKKKRGGPKPFGHYSSKTSRTFIQGEE